MFGIAQSSLSQKEIWQVKVLPLEGDRKPFPFLERKVNDGWAKLSPDGRWMAYSSDESGRRKIDVQPFNPSLDHEPAGAAGGKWQVSIRGRRFPELAAGWEGTILHRRRPQADVGGGENGYGRASPRTFGAGPPKALFETGTSETLLPVYPYAATADGRRFLINTVAGEQVCCP